MRSLDNTRVIDFSKSIKISLSSNFVELMCSLCLANASVLPTVCTVCTMIFASILMTKFEPINIKDTCAFKIIYF